MNVLAIVNMNEITNTAVMWYDNSTLMTFLGVIAGAFIGFIGTLITSIISLKTVDKNNKFELKKANIARKNEVCNKMVQSIYSLQRMLDGLISTELQKFKDESYVIMADAKIYCSYDVYEYYDQFLKKVFNQEIYDGVFVEDTLLPAIRKDLGIEEQ